MNMSERTKFSGTVTPEFKEGMIISWMSNENVDRETALGFYGGKSFDHFVETISNGQAHQFTMDCDSGVEGANRDSSTDCFADFDNNFVIPVSLISVKDLL